MCGPISIQAYEQSKTEITEVIHTVYDAIYVLLDIKQIYIYYIYIFFCLSRKKSGRLTTMVDIVYLGRTILV